MTAILLAALLPWVYWDQSPDTAKSVKEAGIERLYVPADSLSAWKSAGFEARAFDAAKFVKLPAPGVQYRMDVASATRIPWIDANGWRFDRDSRSQYYYDPGPGKASLAAAESSAYDVEAVIRPDPRDLGQLGRFLEFLRAIPAADLPPLANIGLIDDGSAQTGEVMNLLARRNLMFRVVPAPDSRYDLNVRIGTAEYPKNDAANPAAFTSMIRQRLTDDKRLLRLFGSDVVLARLTGNERQVRVHLINYSSRKVEGLRVRVLGEYPHGVLEAFGAQRTSLLDYQPAEGATEFTVPEIDVYAVVDLKK